MVQKKLSNKDYWRSFREPNNGRLTDTTEILWEDSNAQTKHKEYDRKLADFFTKFKNYNPINIDYFLHQVYGGDSPEHKSLIKLGRELIAEVILNCEEKIDDKGNFTRPIKDQDGKPVKDKNGNNSYEDNWYRYLRHDLLSGGTLEREKEGDTVLLPKKLESSLNNLKIITFNYDVSLEYYLLKTLSEIPELDAQAALKNLEILHVYGQIRGGTSPLEIEKYGQWIAENKKSEFTKRSQIEGAAEHISVIGEDKSRDKKVTAKATEMLKDAETLAFFGFGFDEENLKVLGLKDIGYPSYGSPEPYSNNPMGWRGSLGSPSLLPSTKEDKATLLYTNYEDRGKVTNAINRLFKLDQYKLTLRKSTGSVAKALADDFDLL